MCGIAGIISSEKTEFNKLQFNILGSLNDERGGDSCGVFIDGYTCYGIKETAEFRNLIPYIEYPEEASIAFVHCRKTSFINKTVIEQAQPILIKEEGVTKFILMHNGTIKNSKELAEKYIPSADITDLSDSQVMAMIFYNAGYDALAEYEGSAVFAIADLRATTYGVYLFKGSSAYNNPGDKSERPLFIMNYDNKFYFSSMYSPLSCINNEYKPLTVPDNVLIKVKKNGRLLKVKEYDRTKLVAKSTYPVYTSPFAAGTAMNNYSYSPNYNYSSYQSDYIRYDEKDKLYKIGDKPANGSLILYPSGFVAVSQSSSSLSYEYNFFRGHLLISKRALEFLESVDELADIDTLRKKDQLIDYLSYEPTFIDNKPMLVTDDLEYAPCDNFTWVTLFEDCWKMTYNASTGLTVRDKIFPINASDEFKKEKDKIDYNKLQDIVTNLFVI